MDANGNITGSKTFSNLAAGRQLVDLDQIGAPSGSYGFKITGTTTNGTPLTVDGKVAGIVSGFIPGPEQTLLVGSKEISMDDIAEVHLAK